MYGDRVLIPPSLRYHVLQILHAAHQGVSGMVARAKSLYWPGINADIKTTHDSCALFCKNAPSQPTCPPTQPEIPATPFKSIFADFLDVSGYHYFIAGDRLSGWVEVFSSKQESSNAGAAGLISHLCSFLPHLGYH